MVTFKEEILNGKLHFCAVFDLCMTVLRLRTSGVRVLSELQF